MWIRIWIRIRNTALNTEFKLRLDYCCLVYTEHVALWAAQDGRAASRVPIREREGPAPALGRPRIRSRNIYCRAAATTHLAHQAPCSSVSSMLGTQCCGSGMFIPDPGSDFFPSRIRTVSITDPGSSSKNLSTYGILTPKKPKTGI
jgi:hypothetical protein